MVLHDYQILWGGGEDRLDAYIFRVEAFKNKVHPRTGLKGSEGE